MLLCNMKTYHFSMLSAFIFMLVQHPILGSQKCSKLEFIHFQDKVLAVEGSLVNLTFYLNTRDCSPAAADYSITVSKDNNGRHEDVCKIYLGNKCMASASSEACSCLSPSGPMLFSKSFTTADNNSVYVWKWGDVLPGEQEKRITFQVVRHQGVTTDATEDTTAVSKTDAVRSRGDRSDPRDFAIISSVLGVCVLVILTAVIVTACACYRGGFDQRQLRRRVEKDTAMSLTQDVSQVLTTCEDQARNTYDEIPDGFKPHRLLTADPDRSRKSRVELPPLPIMHLRYVATPCASPVIERKMPSSSQDYLHPLPAVRIQREENTEFSIESGVQSPSTMSRQLSNSL